MKNTRVRSRFLLLCFFMGIFSAHADRARPFFRSSRALSMGDAYTPHDVGYESVYYNPASVARPREFQVKLIDFEAIVSKDTFSAIKTAPTNLTQMTKVAETLAESPGKTYAAGASFLPQVSVKNFSFGVMARGMAEAFVEAESLNLNYYSFADLGAHLAVGAALWGGVLKIGVAGRVLNRAELNRTYTPAQYVGKSLDYTNQWQEGMGYGTDVGLILTSPTYAFPRIAIAVLDVGNTKIREQRTLFTSGEGAPGAPADIPQKINAGFGFLLKHGSAVRSAYNFEIKDWANAINGNPLNYFHAGWELAIKKAFSLRAGLNEGVYWTAGAGIQIMGLGLDFATYGENISHRDGGRVDDRKYVVRMYAEF